MAENPPVAPEETTGADPAQAGLELVSDVPLRISVEVGSARLLVRDVLKLGPGSIVELDRMADEPAELFVNGRLVGRGEITVVDERIAVRVVELVVGPGRGEPD